MRILSKVALAATLVAATPAMAVTSFSDDFDSYAPSLNWNGGGVWTTNSVDLVQSGTFGLTCLGGGGNCVDLSGSAPGSISTVIDLDPGTYYFKFFYTGNQLDGDGGGPYPQAGFTASAGSIVANLNGLPNNTSTFSSYVDSFTHLGGALTVTFTQDGGNPFRGSILDSVSISVVPEPATWGLMILGFGAIGGVLRRRNRQSVAGSFA